MERMTPSQVATRLLDELDTEGPMTKTRNGGKVTPSIARPTTEIVSETLSRAIETKWTVDGKADADLARAADVSTGALSGLKTKGCETKTRMLIKVCRALRIDPDAVLNGEIIDVADDEEELPDIVTLAQKVKGTKYELLARQWLNSIVESSRTAR